MKKILVAFFLFSAVFLILFALFRAVPARAQAGNTAPTTPSNLHSRGIVPTTPHMGKNSDEEDEDCMCKDDDASDYPISVTVDRAGNAVPLATAATPVSDKPDLVPALITSPTTKPLQVAPIYVDAYQKAGRLLYRFDALIVNQGGTLDLFQQGADAPTQQVIWAGGNPPSMPDPNFFTSNPSATVEDRSSTGAFMKFVKLPGHNHWHIMSAYTYSLAGRVVSKAGVGFCMLDGYNGFGFTWFKPKYIGIGPDTWCAHADPKAAFIRMGISPGKADVYSAQTTDQWIDITGLAPGDYTLTGTVNPFGYIDEFDVSNNVVQQTRTIPGAIANATAATVQGKKANINLSGSVVGPDIPARLSASCKPSKNSTNCYIMQASRTQLTFAISSPPVHGTVSITSQNGLTATANYMSNPGYTGTDSFTYTATDTRNLTSLPATVQIIVQ
jgi:Lysyl oxidase/Bacterial Ig domain